MRAQYLVVGWGNMGLDVDSVPIAEAAAPSSMTAAEPPADKIAQLDRDASSVAPMNTDSARETMPTSPRALEPAQVTPLSSDVAYEGLVQGKDPSDDSIIAATPLQRTFSTVAPTMTTQPNRLQLIDEDQRFHGTEFNDHLKQWGLSDAGFGYDICAVLGSQSTGKSTLLNRLFGTNFDVMDERARQQTTKGIWLCRGMDRNVLVMDVEGTDGRERGEDQDFERKSALFSLATAECLIVNMWENQVGLFQGANMALLKTVLDVNLSLFQAGRARAGSAKEKTLLLFVIRDFIGTTPLANLEATIRTDLQRIWASLTKPESLVHAELGDFFDLGFATLPHKVLQAKEFDADILKLQRRFIDRSDESYVFKTEYHKRIPIDGLPHYLEGVWEQIVQNKDLDLPTQQELLAQFRCDEIATTASLAFSSAMSALRAELDAGHVLESLGNDMARHRSEALAMFDKDASRYHQVVYARKREDLLVKLNAALLPFFLCQLKNLHNELTDQCKRVIQEGTKQPAYNFGLLVEEGITKAMRAFDDETARLVLPETDWKVDDERAQLLDELHALARTLRANETRKLSIQLEKDMRRQLADPVELALSQPDVSMWNNVLSAFHRVNEQVANMYRTRAASLNTTPDEDTTAVAQLQQASWRLLLEKVHEQTSEAVLASRLRGYFEDRFRYDAGGVPRVWKPSDDIDDIFVKSRDATLALIPLYATIQPDDPSLQMSVVSLVGAPEESLETPSYDEARHVLSERKCAEIGQRFRREADAAYVEAKRGTVSSMSQVPIWMYGVLVVLGWNEAMAVLRNPVYFTLLCMVLATAYVIWRLNLGTPVLALASGMTRELRAFGEEQLRTYLDGTPPSANRAREYRAPSGSTAHVSEKTPHRPLTTSGAAEADTVEDSHPRLPASF